MSFAGKVWRLLVGIKDALALMFLLLFFALLFAALSSRPNPGVVREGALLLKLDGSITEEPAAIDPLDLLLSGSLPTQSYRTRDVVRAIDEAARSEKIKAIALDLTTFTGGGAVTMQEVGEALARFRNTDKPIYAYAVAYSDDSMMLAAHADEIWVDPMGGALIRGPGGSITFYAAALERFDVTAHVFQVGAYKGAGEPYVNTQMSPEFRRNTEAYVEAIWEEYRAHIMQARAQVDFDAATTGLLDLIEEKGGDLAEVAIAAGLADTIGTREEWGAHIAQVVGEDEWDDKPGSFASTDYAIWLNSLDPESTSLRSLSGGKKQIGVITIAGEIVDGSAGPGTAGASRISSLLDDALDDDLAALVVRVNSPGGTVTGSETIRRAILRHKDKGIPIAVSMGDYAASGGYWVATTGDRIFAEPETITGSIGVILAVPSFEDLLAEYGITHDSIRTTPLSGQPDILAGFTPETDALLQAETQAIYDRFVGLVAESRGLSPERMEEIAQGRAWAGGAARQLGLVDQFGGLDAALEWAAQQAGLEEGDWEPHFLRGQPDALAAFVEGMAGGSAETPQEIVAVSSQFAMQERDALARLSADLDRLFTTQGAQSLCLQCLSLGAIQVQPVRQARGDSGWLQLLAGRLSHH